MGELGLLGVTAPGRTIYRLSSKTIVYELTVAETLLSTV